MTDSNNKTVAQQTNDSSMAQKEKAIPMMMRPAADIQESKEGATLYVDLPGVTKDALDIDVDQNILTIKGAIDLNTPENLEPGYMDIHAGAFERRFTLGEELDSSRIEANFNQGELKLFIPRSEKHKPRKIEVKTM
jgi:HSP20 family molecular chaperone IbpA